MDPTVNKWVSEGVNDEARSLSEQDLYFACTLQLVFISHFSVYDNILVSCKKDVTPVR